LSFFLLSFSPVCLSFFLSSHVSFFLSSCLYFFLSLFLFSFLSYFLSTCLFSFFFPFFLPTCLSLFLSFFLSTCLFSFFIYLFQLCILLNDLKEKRGYLKLWRTRDVILVQTTRMNEWINLHFIGPVDLCGHHGRHVAWNVPASCATCPVAFSSMVLKRRRRH
jgi:hypothetical protein